MRPMDLQQLMEPIDILNPARRTAMHHLGQIGQGGFSEVQELLPLEIPLPALARDRRHERRPMVGPDGPRPGCVSWTTIAVGPT